MKFTSTLLVCFALGVVACAVGCASESTDENTGLNPQPLPPVDDDKGSREGSDQSTGAVADSPGAGSTSSSSSSGGAPPQNPAPQDAGTD